MISLFSPPTDESMERTTGYKGVLMDHSLEVPGLVDSCLASTDLSVDAPIQAQVLGREVMEVRWFVPSLCDSNSWMRCIRLLYCEEFID